MLQTITISRYPHFRNSQKKKSQQVTTEIISATILHNRKSLRKPKFTGSLLRWLAKSTSEAKRFLQDLAGLGTPTYPKQWKMEENDNYSDYSPYFPQFLELFPLSFKTSQQSQGSRRWRKAPGESRSRSRPILSSKRRSPGAPPVSSRLPGHNKRIEPDPSSCYENASQIGSEYGYYRINNMPFVDHFPNRTRDLSTSVLSC